jgi:hypothetical protein
VAKNSEDSLGRKNSEDSLVKIQSVTYLHQSSSLSQRHGSRKAGPSIDLSLFCYHLRGGGVHSSLIVAR